MLSAASNLHLNPSAFQYSITRHVGWLLSFEVAVMQGCFLCHQDYITCLHETCPNCELLLPQNQSSQVQDDVPTIHPETENLTNPPLAFESDTPVVLEQHTDLVASVSFNVSYRYPDRGRGNLLMHHRTAQSTKPRLLQSPNFVDENGPMPRIGNLRGGSQAIRSLRGMINTNLRQPT